LFREGFVFGGGSTRVAWNEAHEIRVVASSRGVAWKNLPPNHVDGIVVYRADRPPRGVNGRGKPRLWGLMVAIRRARRFHGS